MYCTSTKEQSSSDHEGHRRLAPAHGKKDKMCLGLAVLCCEM